MRSCILLSLAFLFSSTVAAQKNTKKVAQKSSIQQKIFIKGTLFKELSKADYNRFKDSIFKNTKDTLIRKNKTTVIFSPVLKMDIQDNWVPSIYVFTNLKGNLAIELPNTQSKRYSLLIYDGKQLLHNITNFHEDKWIVEKSNFYHSGWYHFELYCNGELLERNKFYLQ
ncbi:hypothetical protein [Sediminibacterium sp.]|uniref:hypothetical protein n=1 Tax=Sediminibacterium sp. TaxID=1917865 RepID=UPI003F71923E